MTRAIVCINAENGKTLWREEGLMGPEGSLHRLNSPATPTPVICEDRVVAYFGSAGLLCCSTRGQHLWTNRNITFQSVYGAGVSLAAADGIVVLVNAMPRDPKLYALSAESGSILWSVPLAAEGMRESGCSRTPLIKRLHGKQVILVWGAESLEGYALTSGERLWHYPLLVGSSDNVASLVSDSRRLYCVGIKSAVAFDLNALGDSDAPVVWSAGVRGPDCPSPIVTQGLVFFVSDSGTASCLDAKDGRLVWRQRLPGSYYSSPVVMGARLYFTNLDGHTTVLSVAREFRILGENDLNTEIIASPAPVAGRLYFRGEESIICIQDIDVFSEGLRPTPLETRQ
jgi:outer membrane protein assembly factor BamB